MNSTSMSMSLAEGIVSRDIRRMSAKPLTVSDVHRLLNGSPNLKRKKRIQKTAELLNKAKCYWYKSTLEDDKHLETFDIWEWTGTDFRFSLFQITKYGMIYKSANLFLKRHALARIIYRLRQDNIRQAFGELRTNALGNILAIGQVKTVGQQTSYPTEHGIAFVRLGEDGKRVIPTWVDEVKIGKQQRICNNTEYSVVKQLADGANMSLIDWFLSNPRYLKALRDWAEEEEFPLDADIWISYAISEMKREHEEYVDSVKNGSAEDKLINVGVPEILLEGA